MSNEAANTAQDTPQAVDAKTVENVFYGEAPKPDAKPVESSAPDANAAAVPPKDGEAPKEPAPTKTDDKPAAKPEGTEIKYDLKLPKDSKLDATVIDEIAALAKEQGLSNEAAQKLVDRESKSFEKFESVIQEEFENTKTQWMADSKADKEVGGARLPEAVRDSKAVLDRFAPPEFAKMLDETGYGNHPLVLKTFARIGEAMRSGRFISSQSQPKSELTMQEAFYGPDKT